MKDEIKNLKLSNDKFRNKITDLEIDSLKIMVSSIIYFLVIKSYFKLLLNIEDDFVNNKTFISYLINGHLYLIN